MIAGYRITRPEEAGRFKAGRLAQISVYHGMDGNLERVKDCALACRRISLPYVIHRVNYSLLDPTPQTFLDLKAMTGWSDLGFILHDEAGPDWGRVTGSQEAVLAGKIKELESLAPVSFEDAVNVKDVIWFWEKFARSVTLDIGHLEAAGINSVEYVKTLPDEIVRKIDYSHMHRNHTFRHGLTDHWPLVAGCRELAALKELLIRKPDVKVILELNEEGVDGSLALIYALEDELRA